MRLKLNYGIMIIMLLAMQPELAQCSELSPTKQPSRPQQTPARATFAPLPSEPPAQAIAFYTKAQQARDAATLNILAGNPDFPRSTARDILAGNPDFPRSTARDILAGNPDFPRRTAARDASARDAALNALQGGPDVFLPYIPPVRRRVASRPADDALTTTGAPQISRPTAASAGGPAAAARAGASTGRPGSPSRPRSSRSPRGSRPNG